MPQVDTVTVWSQSMHKPIKNVVILPATYNQQDTTRHWPVVYLLHGFRGRYDTWINKTQPALPEAASRMGEIIVCPDGGFSSWYWDSPIDNALRDLYHPRVDPGHRQPLPNPTFTQGTRHHRI